MPPFYSRKSPRAQRYDYHSTGMYFVTICTKNREHYFGEIIDKKMILSDIGKICNHEIQQLNNRKTVNVHEWVVMPNHVHILLWMGELNDDDIRRDASSMRSESGGMRPESGSSMYCDENQNDLVNRPYGGLTLGSVIKLFKGNITKYAIKNNIPFARQSRYHDHIVRDEKAYEHIKYYIQTNPDKRGDDTHYTET